MELQNAINLIVKGINERKTSQVWADLGAGSGLFSRALSALLAPGSTIYAVDKNYKPDQEIASENAATTIQLVKNDFTSPLAELPRCDGIIMANSLHYVKDKLTFLQQLRSILTPAGRIIVVEYDTDRANQWVPWPISCKNLQEFVSKHQLGSLQKLATESSVYQSGGIYSALIIFET
jgi:ubiquinone/menaquinone biosynthesis C-methylase UbiE